MNAAGGNVSGGGGVGSGGGVGVGVGVGGGGDELYDECGFGGGNGGAAIRATSSSGLTLTEQRVAGGGLLLLCSVLQSLYYLTFFILCKWRLWSRHTFFLWLISLCFSNCSNLLMYSFGFALTILKFPRCAAVWNVWAGHFYNFFFAVSYSHFPAMAFMRLLAVWKPLRSQRWFGPRRTLALIGSLWSANLLHVLVLLQFRENWFFFNSAVVGWDAVNPRAFANFFTWYWLGYEVLCIGSSLPSYCTCYFKIRVMHRKQTSSLVRHGHNYRSVLRKAERLRTAEKNLLLIGFALSAIMAVDMILWRVGILLFNGTKYSTLIITMVETVMYGIDAVIILTLSREVRTKVKKLLTSATNTTTSV